MTLRLTWNNRIVLGKRFLIIKGITMAQYDSKRGMLIHNEQVKYISTFLNNLAVGTFLASSILPMFEQKVDYLRSVSIGWPIAVFMCVIATLNLFRLRV